MLTIDEVQGEARSMDANSGWKANSIVKPTINEFEETGLGDAAGEYGLTEVDMNGDNGEDEDQEKDEEDKINDEDDGQGRKSASKLFRKAGSINLERLKRKKVVNT